MKIQIKEDDIRMMITFAKERTPEEACGLIAGTESEGIRRIEKVYFLTNTDHSSEHFSLDPAEHLSAVKDMRRLGYIPLGNWHSHPQTPSRPSAEDIRLAYDSTASYLILSLENEDEPVLNSFHVENGNAEKEELIVFRTGE
ncbi:MAG: M67 family metallopeptidase [Clostridiales bacterium]|nr:M67 family metallopeptidase [Clostridiales bacterium]